MELVNTNDGENYFDPTPKLKSSPVPILFVSFNWEDNNCIYCGEEYIKTPFYFRNERYQKYCKQCLSSYLINITDNNIYLDVYLYTKNSECSEHGISSTNEPQNIQECSRSLEILCFKQIPMSNYFICSPPSPHDNLYNTNMSESEKYCKLCGKSLYRVTHDEIYTFKLCSDCYRISSGYIVSTLTKKPIPIIYLPWWETSNMCKICKLKLTFTSNCQKYCKRCYIIYTGCRYCLTTNIIFGFTNQSQCKKCKRTYDISSISGNSDLDNFLVNLKHDVHSQLRINEFSNDIKSIGNYFIPYSICDSIYQDIKLEPLMEWIPYSQFTDIKKVSEGGFGIICQATWLDGKRTVILKRYKNSQDVSKYFLNELKSSQQCYEIDHHIIKTYGFTRDPELDKYILVMQYASGGDLHNYLQKEFTKITWNKQKIRILWQISEGLETIHNAEFMHRDFHSGNILFHLPGRCEKKRQQWQIGDLGLSQPANNTSNNEIYGVIPYIAPEIFKGSQFSKKSDVYCMGMIMWELTTGCKPFSDIEHDIQLIFKILDGERPEITEDTPECYANLMQRCWDNDPDKRPSATEIRKTFGKWFFKNKNIEPFNKAELKRKELLDSKKLGPKEPHPKAIFTSRPLSSFISKCSSINSDYTLKDYTSIEQKFDIDIEGQSKRGTKRNIEESNINSCGNNGKYAKISKEFSHKLLREA